MARRAVANWSQRQIAGTGYFALQRWGHAVQITRSRIGTRWAAHVYVFQSLWCSNADRRARVCLFIRPKPFTSRRISVTTTDIPCYDAALHCLLVFPACYPVHTYISITTDRSGMGKACQQNTPRSILCFLLCWRDKDWDFQKPSLIDGWFGNKRGIKWIHRTTEKRPLNAKVRSSLLSPFKCLECISKWQMQMPSTGNNDWRHEGIISDQLGLRLWWILTEKKSHTKF